MTANTGQKNICSFCKREIGGREGLRCEFPCTREVPAMPVGPSTADALQIGLLAIAMQQAHDSVQAWLKSQGETGNVRARADHAPAWESFLAAKQAFTATLQAVARKLPAPMAPKTETAVGLVERVKGSMH